MIKTILAIDPSIRSCGYAKFVEGELVQSGTICSREKFPEAAFQIVDRLCLVVVPSIYKLVIEYPTYERSMRGKVSTLQGHTFNLAFLCGLIAERIHHHVLLLPTPVVWKGNVPKTITQMRVREMGYNFQTSDEADAIALALWGQHQHSA